MAEFNRPAPFAIIKMPNFAFSLFLAALSLHWNVQTSNSTASLRGLSAVSDQIVWASGSHGTVLRTLDGGAHWEARKVEGADALDFRDVVGFSDSTALIMSSGTGEAARVYLTDDGGEKWNLVLPDPDKTGFFDAMKFWDRKHGILLGDPVNGNFTILTTDDGGASWTKATQPAALKDEGAFAASGTCLTLGVRGEAWFGSGGPSGGRVFHTKDSGQTWRVANTPLSGDVASSGIFSLKFSDFNHGIAMGGDYQKPTIALRTLALTNDGGQTWTVPPQPAATGFRSAVTYLKHEKMLIAVGTSGSDYSLDKGFTWKPISQQSLNAVANSGNHVWAVGPKGSILKLTLGE